MDRSAAIFCTVVVIVVRQNLDALSGVVLHGGPGRRLRAGVVGVVVVVFVVIVFRVARLETVVVVQGRKGRVHAAQRQLPQHASVRFRIDRSVRGRRDVVWSSSSSSSCWFVLRQAFYNDNVVAIAISTITSSSSSVPRRPLCCSKSLYSTRAAAKFELQTLR